MAKKNTAAEIEERRVLVTQAGYEKLIEELAVMQTTSRKEVADRLAEAISYGDLSENSEYDEAKNQQAFLEARIVEVEDQIKHAEIIEASIVADGSIHIGAQVTLKFMDTGEEHEYALVGSTEADPIMKKISNESPVGDAILGKKEGDVVTVKAPSGEYQYKVLKVG